MGESDEHVWLVDPRLAEASGEDPLGDDLFVETTNFGIVCDFLMFMPGEGVTAVLGERTNP